jgi:hypothetical protein
MLSDGFRNVKSHNESHESMKQSAVKALPKRLYYQYRGILRRRLRGNVQKWSPDLHILAAARVALPRTGTAPRGDTAFGQAVAGFPDGAQPAQRLVLAG